MPGLASLAAVAVASTDVPPYWARTALSAWRAMRPVSNLSGRPAHSISTTCLCSMMLSRRTGNGCARAGPLKAMARVDMCVEVHRHGGKRLALPTNAQAVDKLLIPVLVRRLDVVEQPAPLANHFQHSAPSMVILVMRLEVIG